MILMWNNLLMRIIMQIITLKIILLLEIKIDKFFLAKTCTYVHKHVRTIM